MQTKRSEIVNLPSEPCQAEWNSNFQHGNLEAQFEKRVGKGWCAQSAPYNIMAQHQSALPSVYFDACAVSPVQHYGTTSVFVSGCVL